MVDLTTLAHIKSYLSLDVANVGSDAELTRLITAVSSLIRNWLNRDISLESYVNRLKGNGKDWIIVPNYPIVSITSITVDGVAIAANNYEHTATFITLLNGLSFTRNSTIVISYTAGFSVIPYEIEQVCIEIVAKKFKSRERVGLSSKGMAGETTSYDLKDMRDETLSLLASYTKVVPS